MRHYFKSLLLFFLIISNFQAIAQNNGKYTSIAEALLNPESVIELQLSGITEKLPKKMNMFKNLEIVRLINLSDNYDLNDAFEKLSQQGTVKKLFLYGNKHQTLPESISMVSSLEFVELNSNLKNDLHEIIEHLRKIKKLNSLSLRSMGLKELPANITSLGIKHLNLDNNPNLDYKNIFELLSKLNLESLDLSSGRFTIIPEGIKKLTSLKRVDLKLISGGFNNTESYSILASLPHLEELNIQGNFFGRLDPGIAMLNSLKLIEIDGNCIIEENFLELKNLLPNTIIKNDIPC